MMKAIFKKYSSILQRPNTEFNVKHMVLKLKRTRILIFFKKFLSVFYFIVVNVYITGVACNLQNI